MAKEQAVVEGDPFDFYATVVEPWLAENVEPDLPDYEAPFDALSLELGESLLPLMEKKRGSELCKRIRRVRKERALETGAVIPRVRILDNPALDPREYRIKIKGSEAGRGTLCMGSVLCINPGKAELYPHQPLSEKLSGAEKTKDPTFGLPAVWVSEDLRDTAKSEGYTCADLPGVIATHLSDIIDRYTAEFLDLKETYRILNNFTRENNSAAEALARTLLKQQGDVVIVKKVLQGLLRERVCIRNIADILEAIIEYAPYVVDVSVHQKIHFLTEKARQALARQICRQYAGKDGVLRVLTIERELEQKIIDSKVETDSGVVAALDPEVQEAWMSAAGKFVKALKEYKEKFGGPVMLCSEEARCVVKASTVREIPELAVLSVYEITPDIYVESIGEISLEK